MKIGIVNAGNIGLRLAFAWVHLGHDVMLSKDQHPERLQARIRELASDKGMEGDQIARFQYGSMTDAAKFGEIVILSAYFPRLGHILRELRDEGITLSGKIVIDTMNPLNVDGNFNHHHDLKYMERTSITEELQRAFPEAIIFKAFNSMPATLLDVQKWTPGRVPTIIFIGGNASSNDTVRNLIQDTGFKPRFAGYNLNHSGLLERLGVLLHLLVENEYEGNVNFVFDVMEEKA